MNQTNSILFRKERLWVLAFAAVIALATAFFLPTSTVDAANGVSQTINQLDTNNNGKVNRITFEIDNDSLHTWEINGTLPNGVSVTDGGNGVTVSAISFTTSTTADPIGVQVDLDESDSDLGIDTSAAALELIYTQVTGDQTCTNCIKDGTDNELNAINTGDTGGTDTEADGAAPVIAAMNYEDSDNDGQIDRFVTVFSETVTAASVLAPDDLLLTNVGDFTSAAFGSSTSDAITGSVSQAAVSLGTEASVVDTAENSGNIAASTQNSFSLTDGTNTNTTLGALSNVVFVDSANPILTAVALTTSSGANAMQFSYSEAVTISSGDGATTASVGDYTVAGTVDAFGSFATAGNAATNAATDSTISGDGTATVTLALANQTAGYLVSASTTEPSGVFTAVGDAGVVDANGNQVNTSSSMPTATGGGSWDLTKPTITSITVDDFSGNNGRLDEADIEFSENVRDNSFTDGDGALSSTGGTTTGTWDADADNDNFRLFTRGADDAAVDTAMGSESDLTYSGATTLIRDIAGNLLDTATDGQIASGDSTETDGASPIMTAAALSLSSNRNRITFTYSENVTVSDGASTSSSGDITTAGTVAGFGTFATGGNVTVATTDNTVGGSGSSTITLDLADQAGASLDVLSSTEPSGVVTPVASAAVVDGASNQVNTGNTPTASGGGSWDLTKPTISSVTIADASGNNGKVDQATIVLSEAMRDSNVTDADGSIGGQSGTFTSGTANDDTTVFDVTSDTAIAVDTSADGVDFLYTALTTFMTDRAGNRVDTTVDGNIADADIVQTDGANPIMTAAALTTNGGFNVVTFGYSEAVTVSIGDVATTATIGDMTVAGVVDAFGTFAVAGNTTLNAATSGTINGSGTNAVSVSLASQPLSFIAATSTTEPSGAVTPFSVATVVDAASNQVNVNNTPTATGGGSWDLTKPTVSSIAVSDADNDGRMETAVLTFSENMFDALFIDADADLGATGTTGGSFATGTANDNVTTFTRTDDGAVDTDGDGSEGDFTYSAATAPLRDLAGNVIDTATDGQIATGDVTETDNANPIATTVTLASASNRNRVSIAYSENVTVTDGASTSSSGDLTTAGTIAGFGTFGTTGDVTVPTTLNTVGGSGGATITIDLADQAAGYMNTASTTEPSVSFTPVASAAVVDANSNQVATTAVGSIAGGGSWDLTKPTITSVTVSDSANNNGKIDQAVIVLSEAMRDANVTDADGDIGGESGTFTTGSANDATTTFNVTAETAISVDTSAEGVDFTYSGATTLITDRAGNLLDTATDGQIADGDVTQTDNANPIVTAAVLSDAGTKNQIALTYSEAITLGGGDQTSSASLGAYTTAGTLAGFGGFGTNGDAAMNAATDNAITGSGTATITVTMANGTTPAYFVAASTTIPSGTFTPVGSASVVDGNSNQVNTSGTVSSSGSWDLTKPTITSVTVADATGNNGRIDQATFVMSEEILDANLTAADATIGGVATVINTVTANDATVIFNTATDTASVDTSAEGIDFVYSAATTPITDDHGNLIDTTTDGSIVDGDVTQTDGASPIITSVTLSAASNRNRLSIGYSENMTLTGGDGASTSTIGDITTAGLIAGIGTFSTLGDVSVPTTLNTLGGSGTSTITIDLADQAAGYMNTGSTTEPSGTVASATTSALVDAASNQVNTGQAAVTSSGGGSWDLTKPTISSITVSDAANNDGEIDQAVLVFSEAVRDANITDGDGDLGSGGTTTGTFTTGTANDATTTFNRTSDDNGVNTAASAGDFTYSGATTLITDRAGNLLDTATDGQIATGDSTETDGASPILTAVALTTSSGANAVQFSYSEAITVSIGDVATTATIGDASVAGTIDAFGSFATSGDTATNAATDSTIAGSGTATITISLADQTAGYLVSASTTEPSGVVTPLAAATVVDAASNQVNVNNTPTASGGGSWDLTKPGATITTSDADNDGRMETATLVFSENIRDNSITDADATMGSTGTTTGTFATGTADDTTTVFTRTDDSAVDTDGDGTEGDFVYSGATTLIRDTAGNLYDGTVDGAIATGDETEVDGANPIATTVTLSSTSNRNRISIAYSENVTVSDGASTSSSGDLTTAGTLAGFGTFGTTGDVTVPTTLNTVGGSGSSTITFDLADQAAGYMNTASTTEPSVSFTPVASAALVDAASNQAATTAVGSIAGGGSWDLTKPTISSITVSDSANNDGEIDRAVLVFSEAVRDANITDGDGDLGSGGTTTGTFTTGTANDTTTTFNRTSDDNGVNTLATAGDFTYSGATTLITDRAGNLLDTTTDGQIASGDSTEVDGASPILTAVALTTSSGANAIQFSYSEAVTVSIGDVATTATIGDATVAGVIDAFGTFASAGDTATNAATDSTIAGSGTATITISLADQTAGYLVSTSTTEPSGAVTPQATANVVDAASNQVNTGNTPTASGGGSWDLTKPGATITTSDADNDGRIETATLVFSENIRDNSITDADATLGATGTTTGTFATGTADDTTTVFTRTDDEAVDTAGATAVGDFVYSGATTLIRDTAGNLYDGTVDGAIATGDETEVDGANPIVETAITDDADADGQIDRVAVTFSEPLLVGSVQTTDIAVTGFTVGSSTLASDVFTGILTESGSFDTDATPTTTIAGGNVTDAAANASIAFAAAATDGAQPVLVSASPTNGGQLIPASNNFTLTFSEDLDDATVTTSTITATPSSGPTPTVTPSDSSGTVTMDQTSGAFNPGVTVTVTIFGDTGELADPVGNLFNSAGTVLGTQAGNDATYSFTTLNPSSSGGGGGGGGGGSSTVSVTADTVTVTSPNGSEQLTGGAQHDITWTSTGNINNVVLYYSVDGGSNFGLIAAGTDDDGSYTWTVPNTATSQALIKIVGRDSGGATLSTDQSNSNFIINTDSALPVEDAPSGSASAVPDGVMSRVDAEAALPDGIDVDYLVRVPDDGDATTDFDTTVYYIGLDAKRHPFPSSQTYFTWYENFDDVRTIDTAVLSEIPLGSPVLTRPGTMMVKIQSDPRTFAVEPGDYTIRWVPTEEVAVALFGSTWNTRIMDVEPTYWTRFTMGSDLTADLHPAGSVVRSEADGTKYYFDGVEKRAFASDEAFAANMFQEAYVITAPSSTGWSDAAEGSAITGFEDALFSLQR